MTKKKEKIIRDTTEELFKLLEIDGTFEIAETDGGIDIVLTTDDSGIVIGYHGDMLASLQLILSLCIAKKLGEFQRVSLEVGDYRKNRTEWLTSVAYETKERVLSEGQELSLPDLKPWERRVVHMLLKDDKEVISESIGEGKERVLVIKPKS
ncbi:MAG TPA: R3H domain-containing nucleic acid-binding protein [Candidatus Saccharimonadales bacterium]|nr:R3H domain-containing nucleic acid-binding protein [Candidatus Saccharimonadales bacterium]